MGILLGGLAVLFVAFLVVGAITGRVRATSCCSIPSPEHDLRMRAPVQHASSGDAASTVR